MVSIPRRRRLRPPKPLPQLSTGRLDKGVARYYLLYELLSAALREGSIAPESALPSEPELCALYGISRTTVRRALDRLEREGRIIRRRGSGTYARAQRAAPRLSLQLQALPEAVAALESLTTTKTLRLMPAPMPAPLAAMAAGLGTTAYLLQRLRYSHREPLSMTSTYVAEAIGPRLRNAMSRKVSVLTALGRMGPPIAAVTCSIGAVPADADAARALAVPLGSPLLRVRAVLTDGAGRPRAALESLCRSDRLQVKLLGSVES